MNEQKVQQLLDEVLDCERTPEEVCGACPELLAEVHRRWRQIQLVDAELGALFPGQAPVPSTGPPESPRQDVNLPCIPDYEVEAVLGRGGMGVVFQARHLKLNRIVALKMLLAGAYAGPQELGRFRREAEAVAALRHPHIVQVYDVGDLVGQPYFTMEFVEGGSLAQQLSTTRLHPRQAADLVATLASVMQFAHKSGIIHRDLKPANVLLTADGTPKIADFGLARSVTNGPEFTLSGAKIGTLSYMSPEQALGKTSAMGPAVDIYALGAILYETLTGRPPFAEETAAETERQVIAEEPVPPSRLNASVPRDLETICLKCLHKNPARRYPSAQDLADDLHRFLDGHPVLARPVGVVERAVKWARRRPTLATLVLTLLVSLGAAMGTGVWLQQQKSVRQAAARRAIENGIPNIYELIREEKWQVIKQVLAEVQSRLGDVDADELRSRIARVHADVEFAERLERIRQSDSPSATDRIAGSRSNRPTWTNEYAQAFAQANLDIDDPESTAAKIRESEVRVQTVAALDIWALHAFVERSESLQKQLLRIAQSADPGPAWHDRFRDPAVWRDKQQLLNLTGDAATVTPPPAAHQVAIIGILLGKSGAKSSSMRLLGQELRRRPGDYWLNWEMGDALMSVKLFSESATYFKIVQALRPNNPWTLNRLGGALIAAGQFEEGFAASRRAVALDPNNNVLRHNLAVELYHARQFKEAEAECRRVLENDPENAEITYALGNITVAMSGRYEDAIPIYRRSIELNPKLAMAWYSLGVALGSNSRRNDEAAAAFAESVKLDPTYVLGHFCLGLASFRLKRYREAVVEFAWTIRELDRDKTALFNFTVDPNVVHNDARIGLAESLCCLGRFAEARTATQRAIDMLKTHSQQSQALRRRLNLCVQLLPVEAKLPAILAGNEIPTDIVVQRALAEWFCKYKHLPVASARLYGAAFAKLPSLAQDLDSQNRIDAARAAARAGCGLGDDAGKLDEQMLAGLRKQAFDWLNADLEAWARRHDSGQTMADLTNAARAVRAWQLIQDLACIRDKGALAKLPENERRDWRRLWAEVEALASRDPQPLLDQAQALASRKEWVKAVEFYKRLLKEFPKNDGEVWFEYAAVQLLAGDRQGYRRTCRQMLEGAPEAPKMRAYLLARACTLAPDSVADAALPLQVSASELAYSKSAFWSLTEQGALSYRAKRYKEAVPLLERSLLAETGPGAAVLNWLWLAMTYQRMGEKDEARRWLNTAETWLNSLGNEMPANADALKLHLHNWLEAHVLRREAEMLLSSSPKK